MSIPSTADTRDVERSSLFSIALTVALLIVAVQPALAATPTLAWHLVAQYPHSTSAFTEGLAICAGNLVESMGLHGHSRIEIRTLHTGRVLAEHALSPAVFAEGTTCTGGRILQLTWHDGVVFTYDYQLNLLGRYPYPYEGWGLAFDGQQLIASDGSATLRFFNSRTLALAATLAVHDGDTPVTQLNELEWARGYLWANVWHTHRIARINIATGQVTGWLNLGALAAKVKHDPAWHADPENVLNGIAYDPDSGHFFVTGKRWPLMFEIALGAAPGAALNPAATDVRSHRTASPGQAQAPPSAASAR